MMHVSIYLTCVTRQWLSTSRYFDVGFFFCLFLFMVVYLFLTVLSKIKLFRKIIILARLFVITVHCVRIRETKLLRTWDSKGTFSVHFF